MVGPEVIPVSSRRPAGAPVPGRRGWTWWAGMLVLVLVFAYLVGALLLRVPGIARATDDPQFCGRCHVMETATLTHGRSAHRNLTCGDCHVRQEFLAAPYSKGSQGVQHLVSLAAGQTDYLRVKATPTTQATVQENCLRCHGSMFPGVMEEATTRSCTDCHRETPHGRVKP